MKKKDPIAVLRLAIRERAQSMRYLCEGESVDARDAKRWRIQAAHDLKEDKAALATLEKVCAGFAILQTTTAKAIELVEDALDRHDEELLRSELRKALTVLQDGFKAANWGPEP